MTKKIRKHSRFILPIKIPPIKEVLRAHKGNVPLNVAQADRISFSILSNEDYRVRKIENISYEISIENKWEWVVRYDDHDGKGDLHRHYRVSLEDETEIESTAGIKKYKSKDLEFKWVFRDIKRNYLQFRRRFLKNLGLDLY